jgi:uncharacterized membrane protein
MSAPSDAWPEAGQRIERITWLADAIFAFSMTLLAVDIRVPEIPASDAVTELPVALILLVPRFISFLLTFWIVGSYWITFHRLFSYIVRYDRGLIRASLFFLMFIVLLPFPADLIGRYSTQLFSWVVAAIFFAATGFALEFIWVHASRGHRLVEKELNSKLIRRMSLRYLVSPLVFVFSVPVFILAFTYYQVIIGFLWLLILPFQLHFSHE